MPRAVTAEEWHKGWANGEFHVHVGDKDGERNDEVQAEHRSIALQRLSISSKWCSPWVVLTVPTIYSPLPLTTASP